MRIPQLEYPLYVQYTIPFLPHAFYLGSFILLSILLILNVALVGSDVVTTLVSDPYAIDRPWWMPSFWPDNLRPPIGDGCQPASILDAQSLHTNSSVSLFSYAFRRANVAKDSEYTDPTKRMRPVPYMANPFDKCEVRSIVWIVELPSRRMKFKSGIFCTLGGQKQFTFKVPDNITLAMTHYRSENDDLGQDDMGEYIAYSTFSERIGMGIPTNLNGLGPIFRKLSANASSTSASNVLAVLDGLQKDLFKVLLFERTLREMNNVFYHTRYIVEWTTASGKLCYGPNWSLTDGELYTAECAGLRDISRVLRAYGTTEDRGAGYDLYPEFLSPFGVTTTNFLIALRDAIRIDLGDLDTSSNIYLNKTYFDEMIEIDPYLHTTAPLLTNAELPWRISPDTYWKSCTPWACTNRTWAETYKSIPADTPYETMVLPYRPTTLTASVLDLSYLCPTLRPKPIASLLMSVFVATATMYNFLYAVFGFFMPKAEVRYQKRVQNQAKSASVDSESQQATPLLSEKTEYGHQDASAHGSKDRSRDGRIWKKRNRSTIHGVQYREAITTTKPVLRRSV